MHSRRTRTLARADPINLRPEPRERARGSTVYTCATKLLATSARAKERERKSLKKGLPRAPRNGNSSLAVMRAARDRALGPFHRVQSGVRAREPDVFPARAARSL